MYIIYYIINKTPKEGYHISELVKPNQNIENP